MAKKDFIPDAWSIQQALMRDRFQRHFCMPNFTPPDWFECDVFELTAAGFFREYEIKRTRADFQKDAKKAEATFGRFVDGVWTVPAGRTKHSMLQMADVRGPSQFWFVTPPDLLSDAEIPEWAGHIIVHPATNFRGSYVSVVQVKEAPHLHREKFADSRGMSNYVRGTAYYRLHNEYRTASTPPDYRLTHEDGSGI